MIKVVILAGGKSERIRPLEEKPILELVGERLATHQIDLMYRAGLRDFLLIGNEINVQVMQDEMSHWHELFPEATFELGLQNYPWGSAGALLSEEGKWKGKPILLVSANDVLDLEAYQNILKQIAEKPDYGAILAKEVQSYFPGGYLTINEEDFLENIVEKPLPGEEPSNLMNIVVHYCPFSTELADKMWELNGKTDKDLYQTALLALISEGKKVKAVRFSGEWQAIKFPWHIYDEAEMIFKKEILKKAGSNEMALEGVLIGGNCKIEGPVIRENGVVIDENCQIIGPVFLGKNVRIGANSFLQNCFLEAEVCLGDHSKVVFSHIGRSTLIAEKCLIKHSVIGENCLIGRGTEIESEQASNGNVIMEIKGQKIDTGRKKLGAIIGAGTKIGSEVKTLPGVKIDKGLQIEDGSLVGKDL